MFNVCEKCILISCEKTNIHIISVEHVLVSPANPLGENPHTTPSGNHCKVWERAPPHNAMIMTCSLAIAEPLPLRLGGVKK